MMKGIMFRHNRLAKIDCHKIQKLKNILLKPQKTKNEIGSALVIKWWKQKKIQTY